MLLYYIICFPEPMFFQKPKRGGNSYVQTYCKTRGNHLFHCDGLSHFSASVVKCQSFDYVFCPRSRSGDCDSSSSRKRFYSIYHPYFCQPPAVNIKKERKHCSYISDCCWKNGDGNTGWRLCHRQSPTESWRAVWRYMVKFIENPLWHSRHK